jgi:hypothetical protein
MEPFENLEEPYSVPYLTHSVGESTPDKCCSKEPG